MANAQKKLDFNPRTFLSTIGKGRTMVSFEKKSAILAQGEPTDGLYFIQQGKVQLSVVSENGKEATLGILGIGRFFWRRRSGRPGSANVVRGRDDGLRPSAY